MDFAKLPLNIRNENIQNISVVLNTLDSINFPNIKALCISDFDRFRFINLIQNSISGKIDKDSVYKFCIAYESNI